MKAKGISLTPGFSQVNQAQMQRSNRFSGFFPEALKPSLLPTGAAIFLFVTSGAPAATNDPALALQKGLFEEEANHDFNAAIRAYQVVIKQFDQHRKLAATAVF